MSGQGQTSPERQRDLFRPQIEDWDQLTIRHFEQSSFQDLQLDQGCLVRGLVLHDVPCYGTRSDCQRGGQIHLAGTATTREIAVLRTDDNLVRSG